MEVLEIEPQFSKSLYNLFELSVGSGKLQKAKNYLSRLKKSDPNYPMPNRIMGLFYLNVNKFGMAERFFRLALKENPKEFDAAFYLGILYTRAPYRDKKKETKCLNEAKDLFQQALQTIPADHPQRQLIANHLKNVENRISKLKGK